MPRYWLNEQATVYLSRKHDFSLFKTYPDEKRPGLLVYMASPRYLLAMKAVAGRPEDLDDAARLARELGVKQAEQLMGVVSDFYPDEKAPERVAATVREIARRIDAGKP